MYYPGLNENKALKYQVRIFGIDSWQNYNGFYQKGVEEREHLFSCTSDVLWKYEYHDIQGVRFSCLFYHGQLSLWRLYVFT